MVMMSMAKPREPLIKMLDTIDRGTLTAALDVSSDIWIGHQQSISVVIPLRTAETYVYCGVCSHGREYRAKSAVQKRCTIAGPHISILIASCGAKNFGSGSLRRIIDQRD